MQKHFFPPHVFTLPTHRPLLKCEYFQTGCKNDEGGRFYITNMNLQRAVRQGGEMDLQIAPSNVHHWTFFSLPHAFLSMQIIKYAYVCVHMNLRVIRFYMQMPCEYWCFLVDDPDFLMITVFVIIIFSAVNQVVFYFNIRYCHCYPGLKATLHRDKELERFLAEVSSFSKSILNR